MTFRPGPRRGEHADVADLLRRGDAPLDRETLSHLETFDLIYRSVCALLYNYVPMSGHPGGSISSGRIATALLFDGIDCDLGDPDRPDADVLSYAAGHKALGLYALLALRDEIARIGAPEILPSDPKRRLRLEDLLGFRRNPTTRTPQFRGQASKALDGHPTPATPFVKLATGASGVGVSASLGLALGARDWWGEDAPRVHILEGEGGLTPGRVAEALAAAATLRLDNAVLHVDWNQASIDSDRVCRTGRVPGDYVQWDPVELLWLHDWNVVYVPDGKDFRQVVAGQRHAARMATGQPTAVVYSTVKGWQYGIEGRASHGAGHKLCSDGFFEAMAPLLQRYDETLPTCCGLDEARCAGSDSASVVEECLFEALAVVRRILEREEGTVGAFAARLRESRSRLDARLRRARPEAPRVEAIFETATGAATSIPSSLVLAPGATTTLRGELGRVLGHLNRASGGALLVASADLLGSTSVSAIADGFPGGFLDFRGNPYSRILATGGICEDAMSGILCGLSSYRRHVGVGSSYGAFLAALGHVPARLHAIGAQAKREAFGDPYPPAILVCAHAGLKTGEDGPTHADPQPLQLVQENFPPGTAITLTPWDPQEIWTLVTAAIERRPAVIVPFVTRPGETVLDREALGLAPATAAHEGVYRLRPARGNGDVTVVLQGSAVTYAFLEGALPKLLAEGLDPEVVYVASAELFDLLPEAERRAIYPAERSAGAIGITDFTLPTLYRWVTSERGRSASLHPFRLGRFLGSGPGPDVLAEAGLDGDSQFRAIKEFAESGVSA